MIKKINEIITIEKYTGKNIFSSPKTLENEANRKTIITDMDLFETIHLHRKRHEIKISTSTSGVVPPHRY